MRSPVRTGNSVIHRFLPRTFPDKWRGQDLNLRSRGYEPRELPDCSTPHQLQAPVPSRARRPYESRLGTCRACIVSTIQTKPLKIPPPFQSLGPTLVKPNCHKIPRHFVPPWLKLSPLHSSPSGIRTHKHLVLNQIALPICVQGLKT